MIDKPVLKKPSVTNLLLREKAWEEFCAQPERMDVLARQLIVLELTPILQAAFVCWLLAVLFTFYSLFPKLYRVDYSNPRSSEGDGSGALSIEAFFYPQYST
jgi:hypothetical protein